MLHTDTLQSSKKVMRKGPLVSVSHLLRFHGHSRRFSSITNSAPPPTEAHAPATPGTAIEQDETHRPCTCGMPSDADVDVQARPSQQAACSYTCTPPVTCTRQVTRFTSEGVTLCVLRVYPGVFTREGGWIGCERGDPSQTSPSIDRCQHSSTCQHKFGEPPQPTCGEDASDKVGEAADRPAAADILTQGD